MANETKAGARNLTDEERSYLNAIIERELSRAKALTAKRNLTPTVKAAVEHDYKIMQAISAYLTIPF